MTTWLYHITHISNLASIVAQSQLCCEQLVIQQQLSPIEIGYRDLKDRRSRWQVPKGPGGTLSDYVPFYFASRSPMLWAISKGRVPGYNEGQQSVIHLVTTVEQIVEHHLPCVFTDGHAYMALSNFFDNLADLHHIDWHIMKERIWRDTPEDGDRARRRQAEFLVHQTMPWFLIRGIGVYNEQMLQRVQHALEAAAHQPKVAVRPTWYY